MKYSGVGQVSIFLVALALFALDFQLNLCDLRSPIAIIYDIDYSQEYFSA